MIQIAVIGKSKVIPTDLAALAEDVGRGIARHGWTLLCGGRDGIMEAVCKGAKSAGGTTVGILPETDRESANPYVDIVVSTGIGYARNISVVASGDAVVAIGGSFGTLSELAYAASLGRPIFALRSWKAKGENDTLPVVVCEDAAEVIARLEALFS